MHSSPVLPQWHVMVVKLVTSCPVGYSCTSIPPSVVMDAPSLLMAWLSAYLPDILHPCHLLLHVEIPHLPDVVDLLHAVGAPHP